MRKTRLFACLTVLLFVLFAVRGASAQTDDKKYELGVQIVSLQQRAFGKVDCGFGGRFTFYPVARFGLEAEANVFPTDLGKPVAFSGPRAEILFGIKAGPRIGPFGLFGKLRPGLIRFSQHAITCAAVFPPSLECKTSSGSTNIALDIGGGIETVPWGRSDLAIRRKRFVVRLDVGDTLIRFKGPVQTSFGRFNGPFFVHNLRVSAGIAFRF